MNKLDNLVSDGTLQSYSLKIFNADGGEVEKTEGFRNTEKLTLTFSNGQTLTIESFCNGSSEDTCLFVK
jgi:hypothetical protein